MVALPIDPYREIVAALQHLEPGETLNVRGDKTTVAPIVERLEAGQTFGYIWPPVEGQDIGKDRGNLWVKVKVRGVTGYAHKYYLVLPEDEPAPTPEPKPQPEPDPTTPPSDGTPTLTAAEVRAIVREELDARLGPVLRILSVLMAGYMSDRENDTRNFNNLVTEVQKEIETRFPDSKEAA